MGASQYKLGALVSHVNTILNYLTNTKHEGREALFIEFFGFLQRLNWIVTRQKQESAAKLIQRGLANVYLKAVAEVPTLRVDNALRARIAEYRTAYRDLDLTIVVPVFNGADLLPESIESILKLKEISYNVLIVDDGSTDKSLEVMSEYAKDNPHIHVFEQSNRGAGRARNSVIPLITARYTYFLDSDDVIDPEALQAAIKAADEAQSDLLFTKYRIENVDEGRTGSMFNADAAIWDDLKQTTEHKVRQKLASGLINYPWNRIIRTSLLHDSNIFFGPTVVHNDILFHWHSTLAATNIGFLDVEVCTHRKFKVRPQVTNIVDKRRMTVLDALQGTHQRISQLESYGNIRDEWARFSLHLIDWARERVPKSVHATYDARAKDLTADLDGIGTLNGALNEQSTSETKSDDIRRLRNWIDKLKETNRVHKKDIKRLRNWNNRLKNTILSYQEEDTQRESVFERQRVEPFNEGEPLEKPDKGASPSAQEHRQQSPSPTWEQPT